MNSQQASSTPSTTTSSSSTKKKSSHGVEIFQQCSQHLNNAIKLYNQKQYGESTTSLFSSSATLGMQYVQTLSKTLVTDRNKEALLKNMDRAKSLIVKSYEMKAKCLYCLEKYREATQCIVQGIVFSDFHLWEQQKDNIEKMMDIYVKSKYHTKMQKPLAVSTYTLHHFLSLQQQSINNSNKDKEQQKCVEESIFDTSTIKFSTSKYWVNLLELELKHYETMGSVFLQERNLAIDQILTHYDREKQTSQYINILYKRCHIYYEQGHLKLAIDHTNDILSIMNTQRLVSDEIYLRVLCRLFLVTIQHFVTQQEKLTPVATMAKSTTLRPLSIEMHQSTIAPLVVCYKELMKLFEQFGAAIKYITEDVQIDDDLLDDLEHCLSILEYYGHSLVIPFVKNIVSNAHIKLHRRVLWLGHAARVFLDMGDVKTARTFLRKASGFLCGDNMVNIDAITYASHYIHIIQAYYYSQTDEINKALDQLQSVCEQLPTQDKYADLQSLCKYYYAFVYQQGRSNHLDIYNVIDHAMVTLSSRLTTGQRVTFSSFGQCDDLCSSLLQVGLLHECRGYLREAVYYLTQGLATACKLFCVPYAIQFVTSLGNIERKRNVYSSVTLLTEAVSLWRVLEYSSFNQVQCLLSLVELSIAYREMHEYEKAIECLDQAQPHLNTLVLSFAKDAKIATPVKSRRSYGSISSNIQQESYTVQSLRVLLECHYALALYSMGHCNDATGRLQTCMDTMIQQQFDGQEKALVHYYIGNHFLKRYLTLDRDEYHGQIACDYLADASSQISFDMPAISKPVLSAMALCVANQDTYHSSYLAASSMGITMKHVSSDIMRKHKDAPALKQFGRNLNKNDCKNEIEQLTHLLPHSMPVVNISLSHDCDYIILNRIEKNYEPLVIYIPITKQSSSQQTVSQDKERYPSLSHTSMLRQILVEYDRIIEEDKKLGEIAHTIKQQEDIRKWWHRRVELDDKMKQLLVTLEEMFGCWKILLVGPIADDQMKQSIEEALPTLIQSLSQICGPVNVDLVRIILSCTAILSEQDMRQCIGYLMGNALIKSEEDVKTCCDSFYEAFLSTQNNNSNTSNTSNSSSSTESEELVTPVVSRANRRRRKQSNSSEPSSPPSKKRKLDLSAQVKRQAKKHSRCHIILIFDKLLQRLPIESIPILRSNSISRMPSMFQLYCLLLKHHGSLLNNQWTSGTKCYYVLNPSKDLVKTEDNFLQQFKEAGWNGINGQAPTHEQVESALDTNDVFVYMGHGSGAYQYYQPDKIQRQVSQCASIFLMGCSSGELRENGQYEPSGCIQSFLLANSPCVVANLYDVTSTEIDKVSQYLIRACLIDKKQNVCQAVIKAKQECRLTYLMGSATVCYGLPIKFE
jgi:tetratricopeptide (TPR) repeat protein